jgi:glutathione S-transferase
MKEIDQDMDTSDWAVPPPPEKMLRERIVELEELHFLDAVDQEERTKMLARIALLEAELADWQSGKRYMGGTGQQPGDLFHEHLVQLGATLGKTAGYSTVGSCDPIADVKALTDRIAALEAALEEEHENITAEIEKPLEKRSWDRLARCHERARAEVKL